MAEKRVCSICGREFTGYGNNAEPINDGICCDECNLGAVIPRRMAEHFGASLEEFGRAADAPKDCKADGAEQKGKCKKGKCIDFIIEFESIKHWMVVEDMKLRMSYSGTECEEKRDKLLEKTAKKLVDLAKHKLDDKILQGLLSDFMEYVGDDIDLIVRLYMEVTGKIPVILKL